MKHRFAVLILCATVAASTNVRGEVAPVLRAPAKPAKTQEKDQDKELEKIALWFEQMDAILREGLWVMKKERPPLGKSVFGKMQRAVLVEMKKKLSNKSLFRCDVYSMSRTVRGLQGFPQTAEAFHKCNAKENFTKFGEWTHPTANELQMQFQGNSLEEVLGMATGIFNPKISCKLKSNDSGLIETFSCQNFMIDFNPAKSQVLKFSRLEFEKTGKQILHLKAEVLENLEPVRRIEAEVPREGKITVTETVLKGPVVVSKQVPAATPPPPRLPTRPDGGGQDAVYDQNGGGSIRPSARQPEPGAPVGPSAAGRRGERPIPAELVGTPGDPRGAAVPGVPPGMPGGQPGLPGGANGVTLGPDGQPVPPEQQEGEYNEGGPLPYDRIRQPGRGQVPQQQQQPAGMGAGGVPAPGTEPMPPPDNHPR